MNNCFCCKHRGALVNQGIHWCGLQIEGYPDKEDCEYYEEIEISVTLTSSTAWYKNCQGCAYYMSTTAVDMKKTCNECINEHSKRGYY